MKTPRTQREPSPSPFEVEAIVEALAYRLGETAIERDREGGHAAHERDLIRASGLLGLSVPAEHGGQGADWHTVFRAVRRLARADAALAHVFGFHHLQLAGVRLHGSPDQLTVSAWHEPSASMLIGIVPTRREGVRVNPDWDAFGQRQTDSGTVAFEQVLLAHHEVLQAPGVVPTPQATLRSQIAQLHQANLYVGIAVAEAKVLAHRAGIEISSQVFELTGARSTSVRFGLDRFWRNARVHTLHDPVDYKLRDLGRHALTGIHPEPTAYS